MALAYLEKHRKKLAQRQVELAKNTPVQQSKLSKAKADVTLTTLRADLQALKGKERTEKDAIKLKLLDKFKKAFDEAIKAPVWGANELIFYYILWLFDTNQFAKAFEYAKLAIERKITSPLAFKRPFATLFADSVFAWAKDAYDKEQSVDPYLNEFIDMLGNGLDISPIPKAKLFKLWGMVIQTKKPRPALGYFIKAAELDNTIGVKGRIKELIKQLEITKLPEGDKKVIEDVYGINV